MIQALAHASGLPNQHVKAFSHKTKMATSSEVAKKELKGVGVGDDDVEEFRSVTGEELFDTSRLDSEKKSRSAQAVADMLSHIDMLSQSAGQSPIGLDAVGVQAQQDVADKATGKTPLRDEEHRADHTRRLHEVQQRNTE